MTADEMKRQKADLLLEHQDTEKELEHLRMKAQGLGEQLIQFGTWMRDDPQSRIFRADQAHHGHNVMQTPLSYMSLFEATQYFALADEIRQKREKLRKLTEQKERLGLK